MSQSTDDSLLAGGHLAGLEQRVLRRYQSLDTPPGTVIVAGFSGGADSLALIAVLARVRRAADYTPIAVHVDHQLRSGSDREQLAARQLADALGVEFLGVAIAPAALARHRGVGVEEAARRERYRALRAVSDARNATVIAVAHHQQDQAETVLLHLLRGAGLSGAAGMTAAGRLPIPWWDDREPPTPSMIWRPFLMESKDAVRAYAKATRLVPLDDPSNDDLNRRRNAIRHQVVPLLAAVSPGAVAGLARSAEIAAEDDAYLTALSLDRLAAVSTPAGGLRVAALGDEPLALQRRIVRRWVERRSGYRALTAERVAAILHLAAGPAGGRRVELGEGWTVSRTRGALTLWRADREQATEARGG